MRVFTIAFSVLFLASCQGNETNAPYDPDIAPPPPAPKISYQVIAQYPHDTGAYTQGLQLYNGKMYEGTGDYSASSIRISDYKTGKVEKNHNMGSDKIFGEGINIFKGLIYQLTWQSNIVYVYQLNNIEKPIKTLTWPYEGWGITNNGKDLIISDGSANLYFVNPENFKVLNTIAVTESGKPVDNLNELEYINGFIFANVYQSSDIVKIDPESGQVKGRMTFDNLLQPQDIIPARTDVLNGIAYDSVSHYLIITGKRWPKLFEVKLN